MKQERKILYKVESGSKMYGTTTPESDTDYISVFMPLPEDILSLEKTFLINNSTKQKQKRRNTKDDIDDMMYSLPKFVSMLLYNNPTILEMLFCKAIIELPIITELKNMRSDIVSMRCYVSFIEFAKSQKNKMEYKAIRYKQLEKSIEYLSSLFSKSELEDTKLQLGETVSNWLNKNLTEYKGKKNNVESFNKGLPLSVIYSKIVYEFNNYGSRVNNPDFLKLLYDKKAGYHAIRLLYEAEQILSTGKLVFPLEGKVYDNIMRIKRGEVFLSDFYILFDEYLNRAELAKTKSTLPMEANVNKLNNWLVNKLVEYIKEY